MIDHVTIPVSDLTRSKRFYTQAFKALGYTLSFGEKGSYWAYDINNGLFEIYQSEKKIVTPAHVAFRVKTKKQIRAFYDAAIRAGGKDNGAPGPCPEYTTTYYAAFVFDPDGHNVEVMLQ